jgi:DnaJ family protein C protein 13
MATAAAECVRSLSVCVLLQTRLFQSGALWQLLPNLFTYDATLAVTSEQPTTDGAQTASTQALANQLARVSCEASAAMCGYMDECPEHDGVQVRLCLRIFCTCGGHTQNALCALLTRYVVRCMRDRDPPDRILQLLNANVETPYMIWNNATRAEMLQYVEKQRHPTTATSELFGADFCLSILNDELIVGDVYVRVYNQQPSFVLTQPKQFAADLLEYLSVPAVRSCLCTSNVHICVFGMLMYR